jgi:L-2-hydroxyglutarate oxidase
VTVTWDVVIIGGGIVGTAAAAAVTRRCRARVLVLEAEEALAAHQTGHNSGVVHSGLYYAPGSLKARLCTRGREALTAFCRARDIPHERCGKVVVAVRRSEIPALDELERRGRENGLEGLRRLSTSEVAEIEPHCWAAAGMYVPQTGIVDYTAVARALACDIEERGGRIRTASRATAVVGAGGALVVETTRGRFHARNLVNCAGLQSDRVARMCGSEPGVRIVPFRGEYYELRPSRRRLVRNLIYPVPDPRLPFLGAHLTRTIHGGVEAGPNAVLAFHREGYRKRDVSIRDVASWSSYPGFWRMAGRFWDAGLHEMHRSLVKRAFVASLAEMIPEITAADVIRGPSGVRAQALRPNGRLVDDFHVVEDERMIHVLNAPSPAATACLAIGEAIADRALRSFGLDVR